MENLHRRIALAIVACLCLAGLVVANKAKEDDDQGKKGAYVETDLVVNKQVNNIPTLTDANGVVHIAKFFDPNLKNPWGISESPSSPFWVSDNNAGLATLYNTAGMPQTLVVSIPSPADPLGASGTPTGTVFNFTFTFATPGFMISGFTNPKPPMQPMPTTQPAIFLFATEDGTIVGWNPNVNPPNFDPKKAGTYGIIAVPAANMNVYKGLAIATDASGTHLYATNFHAGTVDVFDTLFNKVNSPGAFVDSNLPSGYSPFNIALIADRLFVTYAVRDNAGHDDVKGLGNGLIDTFSLDGSSVHRFAEHGQLDSPWGLVLALDNFGQLGGTLWVGNFGNGRINAYDLNGGTFVATVRDPNGKPIVIDGLWTLKFGNGGNGGDQNTLYFTAGPNDESDGIFGSLAPGPVKNNGDNNNDDNNDQ
jgi:uncharacterized protein (TIGR03118 family)